MHLCPQCLDLSVWGPVQGKLELHCSAVIHTVSAIEWKPLEKQNCDDGKPLAANLFNALVLYLYRCQVTKLIIVNMLINKSMFSSPLFPIGSISSVLLSGSLVSHKQYFWETKQNILVYLFNIIEVSKDCQTPKWHKKCHNLSAKWPYDLSLISPVCGMVILSIFLLKYFVELFPLGVKKPWNKGLFPLQGL